MNTNKSIKAMVFLFVTSMVVTGIISGESGSQFQNVNVTKLNSFGSQGNREVLFETGFEEVWILDEDVDYYTLPQWDIDGICSSHQENNEELSHYWFQIEENLSYIHTYWSNSPLTPPYVHSGQYAAGIWRNDGWNEPLGYLSDEWLISQSLDFDSSLYDIELEFWSIYVPTRHGSLPFPWTFEVDNNYFIKTSIDDGETWETVADLRNPQFTFGVTDDVYNDFDHPVTIELDSLRGKSNVRIAWHYYFDGEGDDDESNTDLWVIDDVCISGRFDGEKPRISVEKPEQKTLYIDNIQINQKMRNTIILGDIDIEIDASDYQTGIQEVQFYLDGTLKETIESEPFVWKWNGFSFGKHTISVNAIDYAGNIESKEITVIKFF